MIPYATIAYDAATGTEVWLRQYGARRVLLQHRDGPCRQCGREPGCTSAAQAAGGRTPTTTPPWPTTRRPARRCGCAGTAARARRADFVTGLSVSPDGAPACTSPATARDRGPGYDYATVAYDAATGAKEWVRRHDGRQSGWDRADGRRGQPRRGNGVRHGESTNVGPYPEYGTLAYDAATGAVVWQQRYRPMHNGAGATAIAVGPAGGTVFVTGVQPGVGTRWPTTRRSRTTPGRSSGWPCRFRTAPFVVSDDSTFREAGPAMSVARRR